MSDFEVNFTLDPQPEIEADFTLDPQPEIEADFSIEVGGITEHNLLSNRDLPDQHPISAITGLQEALDTIPDDYVSEAELEAALLEKQDVIRDLSEIRQGATLGATAVQPSELESYATTQYVDNGLAGKQDTLTAGANVQIVGNTISATDTTYTAGTGISIVGNVISNTQTSAEWGNIGGDITAQTDLQNALNAKANVADIPTKTSDLTNDSGFITLSALTPYATQNWVSQQGYLTEIPAEYVTDSELTAKGYQTAADVETAITAKGYTTMSAVEAKGYITNAALVGYATENYVDTGLNGKQDKLTQTQLDAVNSGANTTNIGQIATNTSGIADINALIPNQATSSNQLADKDFVNSSINSMAAFYITSDVAGDPFATRAALIAGPYYFRGEIRTPTQNDYALVSEDETHDDLTSRYMYDGGQWVWQYTLNNTKFTQAQIDAINSGITEGLVAKISTNETAINNHIADKTNPHEVTKAQVGLGNVDNTSDLNKPISTATQTALNGKQNTISDLATIRTNATNGASAYTTIQSYGNIVTHNVSEFATSAQGALADTAVQPSDLATKQDVLTSENAGNCINIAMGGSSGLPSEYQELEYLQSSGNQYIDTGIVLDDTMTIRIKYDFIRAGFVFGSRNSASSRYSGITNENLGAYNIRYGNTVIYTQNTIPSGTVDVVISPNGVVLNGETVSTTAYGDSFYAGNCYLFTTNSNGSPTTGEYAINRIRRFTIDNVIDLVPCKRKSDDALGMYDLVNDTFLTNAGTGTFIAGGDVEEITKISFVNDAGYITSADLPTNHVTTDTAQDITGLKTIKNQLKIQSGYADGALFIGADATATTLSNNTRKVARVNMPTQEDITLPMTIISGDTRGDSGSTIGQTGNICNRIEFGGRTGATGNTSPDGLAFCVAKVHNSMLSTDKVYALEMSATQARFNVQPNYKGTNLALSTDIPTVNNPTITFTQGGTTKGTITLNQSGDQTIAFDAGGGGSDVEAFTAAEVQAIWEAN